MQWSKAKQGQKQIAAQQRGGSGVVPALSQSRETEGSFGVQARLCWLSTMEAIVSGVKSEPLTITEWKLCAGSQVEMGGPGLCLLSSWLDEQVSENEVA